MKRDSWDFQYAAISVLKSFLKSHTQNVVEKLVPEPFIKKTEIELISRSTVWKITKFVFIVWPRRDLPKYIKSKMLTICSYKGFLRNKKEVWN